MGLIFPKMGLQAECIYKVFINLRVYLILKFCLIPPEVMMYFTLKPLLVVASILAALNLQCYCAYKLSSHFFIL